MNGDISTARRHRTICLVATEESGDRLGAGLMKIIRQRLGDAVSFHGVGGRAMKREGLNSLFSIDDMAIIGFSAVVRRLPMLLRRIKDTAMAVLAAKPDVLVIIDSPDFTHRVARQVRAANAAIPIVDYVSPSVWAWRPGRARAMRVYVDHVLALLPFEPDAYVRLKGPLCTYVGHPLTAQIDRLRPDSAEQMRRDEQPPVLLVLPGSRRSEIRRHMPIFGAALEQLAASGVSFEAILPTTPHLEQAVTEAMGRWRIRPRLVVGDAERMAVFRTARAALAKSGTVTLELAVSGVPMVGAYRAGSAEAFIARRMIRLQTVILANLVVGENVVPEFLQQDCTPDKLATALRDVLDDTPVRTRQLAAFSRIDQIMSTGAATPSARAADIVLDQMRSGRRPN